MTNDLFFSKEHELLKWCERTGFFSTSQVMQYAVDNYYLRAGRTVRDFVQQGKVRKVGDEERRFRNLHGKMSWWAFVRV